MTDLVAQKPQLEDAGKRRIATVILTFAIIYSLMFWAAGSLKWAAAWVFVIISVLNTLTIGIYVAWRNPELINERGRKSDKTKSWDKIFSAVFAPMIFLTPITAGFDFRFSWSDMPMIITILAYIGVMPGLILPYWAMLANKFLVTTVRLQEERDQYVVQNGPYRFVRHPMYTGAVLTYLTMPLALGSWWALIPGGIAIVSIIVRTALEDKTLQNELPGYTEYAKNTRYRLIPGLW
ncbi:MAG: isoprenylcysteine carboxylmethyltransferase family protein [Anaerolineales bacterium]|nr:isoprenylcysteine carboxylmethyltransferase family protein [Anaerolineales bacterium]